MRKYIFTVKSTDYAKLLLLGLPNPIIYSTKEFPLRHGLRENIPTEVVTFQLGEMPDLFHRSRVKDVARNDCSGMLVDCVFINTFTEEIEVLYDSLGTVGLETIIHMGGDTFIESGTVST